MLRRCAPRCIPRIPTRTVRPSTTTRQFGTYLHRPTHHERPLTRLPTLPSRRSISTLEGLKIVYKKHPVQMSLAIAVITTVSTSLLIFSVFFADSWYFAPYARYPDAVAKELRKAVYFSGSGSIFDAERALKYYVAGFEKTKELGMHPFSDEVLGIRLSIAELYHKVRAFKQCIDIYEITLKDCLRFLDMHGKEEKVVQAGDRTRLLKRCVEISLKLGELYASDHVLDTAAAEEKLVWAVETALREKQRRQTDGLREGEGEWLTDDEFGASLEQLAMHYEAKDQHYLATPLLLQAINLAPRKSCHAVVLMSNLATCLAQQRPPPSTLPPKSPSQTSSSSSSSSSATDVKPSRRSHKAQLKSAILSSENFPSAPAPERSVLRAQATQWAKNTLQLASSIQGEERTEECDQGCVVATHNLGEFAAMEGRVQEADEFYRQARELASRVGFEEGVMEADKGLERLQQGKAEK